MAFHWWAISSLLGRDWRFMKHPQTYATCILLIGKNKNAPMETGKCLLFQRQWIVVALELIHQSKTVSG